MKLDVQMIPGTISFIGWYIILPADALVLKDKIQALVDAGVLILKSEQKKVTPT